MTRRQYQALVYFIHFVAVAVTLILIVLILPGFQLETSFIGLIFVTGVFSLLTTVIKPLIEWTISPLLLAFSTISAILLNTLMLYMTEVLTDGIFAIDNIFWAIVGGIIVGVISGAVNGIAEIIENRLFVAYRRDRRQKRHSRIDEIRAKALEDDQLNR